MHKLTIIPLLCLLSVAAHSQDTLTLNKAIEIALVNNNLLQVSKRQKDIANNEYTIGNAGFLPTLSALATATRASNNQRAIFFSGLLQERTNAKQIAYNAGLNANWVLYNGFRRINLYQRLKTTFERADVQTKADIQSTISQVSAWYFEAQRQLEIAQAYQNTLELYTNRLQLAQTRFDLGLGAKSDVLITKVDINTQRSLLIRQRQNIDNAKSTLNSLLNIDPKDLSQLSIEKKQPKADTNVVLTENAPALIVTQKNITIAERIYKENNSLYHPVLSAGLSYNYARLNSESGQFLSNNQYGPVAGLTLAWSLFDGFNKNRITKNARLQVEISRLLHQENLRDQQLAFQKALLNYKAALQVFQLEMESYSMAKQSNEIAQERYKGGIIHLFEFKETQLVLESTKIRLANARFDALTSEIELKRLNGQLIEQ